MADDHPRPPLAARGLACCKVNELHSVSASSPFGFPDRCGCGTPAMPWLGQGAADPGVAGEQHTAEAVKPQAMDRTSSGVKLPWVRAASNPCPLDLCMAMHV